MLREALQRAADWTKGFAIVGDRNVSERPEMMRSSTVGLSYQSLCPKDRVPMYAGVITGERRSRPRLRPLRRLPIACIR